MSTSAHPIPVKTGRPVSMGRTRTDARAFPAIPDSAVKSDKMSVRQTTPAQMARNADRDTLTTSTALVAPVGSAKSATKDRVSVISSTKDVINNRK